MAHVQRRRQTQTGRTVYRVRWTAAGRERSKTFDTRREADAYRVRLEHDQRTGGYVDPAAGRRTFGGWWTEWLASRQGLRRSTVARDTAYGRTLILPTFAAVPLASIDHLSAQRWVTGLQADHAPATVHKACQLASGACQAAVRSRLIQADPFAGVTLPRIERSAMRFLTPDQVATLAETIQPAYRPFVLLAAYGGLRFGELAGLRRAQLDLLARTVTVVENCVEVGGVHTFGQPKTAAGRRRVPLPRVVADALEAHCAGMAPDALVFTAPKGGPLRASLFRRRVWQPACAVAGVDGLRIHDLRHTAVALWIAAGATPLEIAHRAGHASVSVVLDRYGHLLPGLASAVNDRLDELAASASAAPVAPVYELRRAGGGGGGAAPKRVTRQAPSASGASSGAAAKADTLAGRVLDLALPEPIGTTLATLAGYSLANMVPW